MPEDQYVAHFALLADHGIDYADNLEPLTEIGVSVPVPALNVDSGELEVRSQGMTIRPEKALSDEVVARIIPDTRFVETTSAVIASALLACGQYEQIDPPTKKDIGDAEKETRAHVEAMELRDKQVDAGDIPAPDATDVQPTDADPSEQPATGQEA